ncbi:MAG: PAS domain-containing protein, partial [Candidatus Heimdallarchaeota archaeon]
MKKASRRSFERNNTSKKSNDSENNKKFQEELELTKRELEAIQSRFNSLFESTNDAIILMDFETLRYIMANEKAAELYGFKLDEIDKLTADSFIYEDERENSL